MMDSYSSFRDSTDRTWGRDDRDDRGDSFNRPRSPVMERRERRRSRSPGTLDRYEPRSRRDGRERDDRRRMTPPANIDRYVPGQDNAPAEPLTNPLADPATIPYQVGFAYYSDWWRINEKIKDEERTRNGRRREPERARGPRDAQEERDKERAKIQAAYSAYKEEMQAKVAASFVSEHKKEQWFGERYVPKVQNALRAKLNDIRREAYTQWEQDLESGVFDTFSLEGLPKSQSNGAGGVIEKEEGEATASNEILGVDDLVPAPGADLRDDTQSQPTLLIKTIAPHVSRQNLEEFCKENLGEGEGGFRCLSLSDPNPAKRFHRIGWVMLHPASENAEPMDRTDAESETHDEAIVPSRPMSTAEKALDSVNGKTVKDEVRGDFVCHVRVHNPPSNPRKKALWDLFSAPERIEKDLILAQRLVNRCEQDFGSDFRAVFKVEEKTDELRRSGLLRPITTSKARNPQKKRQEIAMDEAMDDDDSADAGEVDAEEDGIIDDDDDDDENDDEDLAVKKKQLDLLVEYLRRVFNMCLFCVFESDSVHELSRKCPGGHLRRPRSTITSTARLVARASVNGEGFPEKKQSENDAEIENDSSAADKKFHNLHSKSEQQLLRAFNWVKNYEDKLAQLLDPQSVNLRKLGGRPINDAVDEELTTYVKQEDEHKWRCRVPDCTKLFKEEHFWRKHVEKRHTEWLDAMKQEFELINAYVLDPAHPAPARSEANPNGQLPAGIGSTTGGAPRGFNFQNFPMNNIVGMPPFPLPPGGFPPMLAGMQAAGWNAMGDSRNNGPIRRGGFGGGRGQYRSGPYDRRGGGNRWDGGMGRNRMGGSRWGDGAGAAAGGPREAVQGRSLKSYEDLDQVTSVGGGELNY